jgi:hypothetical protein
MTTTIHQYTADDLPAHFMWQIFDFARMEWCEDGEPFDLPLDPERWHPTYFVINEDQYLVSSATVVWKTIQFQHQSYKL